MLFRLHLHIQKLRNMTGVISETTEKIILTDKLKVVFSVVSDFCKIKTQEIKGEKVCTKVILWN